MKKLGLSVVLALASTNIHAAETYTTSEINEILSAANKDKILIINKNLKLPYKAILTRPVRIRSSDITIDLNSGEISVPSSINKTPLSIESKPASQTVINPLIPSTYVQTKNITIKNGTIRGATTFVNHTVSLEYLKLSSRSLGHTARMQAVAPKNINFSNINFISNGVDVLYLTQGSTYVTIQNSTFKGTISGVAIYLDAESGFNTIKYNNFKNMTSSQREIIAVDGSANNFITYNQLQRTDISGGIFLYRNCGEAGVVRHQPPQYNTISYNTIYTNNCLDPSDEVYGTPIFLNSRMGNRNYCSLDSGYSFGSSINDFDFAQYNQVAYNTIQSCTTTPPLIPPHKMLIRDGYRDYTSSQPVQSFFSSGFGNNIYSNTATQAPLVFSY